MMMKRCVVRAVLQLTLTSALLITVPLAAAYTSPAAACMRSQDLAIWSLSDESTARRAAACALSRSRILLVGEIHGTLEVPRFVGDLVSQQAEQHPVVLALERTDMETDAMNAFLSSSGSPADRQVLSRSKGWSGGMQDGRSSLAMLDLLDRVRKLRQSGKRIDVLLTEKKPADMSVLNGPGAAQRYAERSMASSIRDAVQNGAHDAVIIGLMGAYHVRIANGGPYGPSVTGQLNDFSPTVALVDGEGSAWTCIDGQCKAHRFKAGSQLDLAGDDHDRKANDRVTVVSIRFPVLTPSVPASSATPQGMH